MIRRFMIGVLFIFGSISFLAAGTFKMDTGEKIRGKLYYLGGDAVKIQTEYGDMSVPLKKIVEMDFSGESFDYVITLKDSSLVKGNLISYAEELFVVNTSAGIINIGAKNVSECVESGYASKAQQDKATEEANRALGRVNHVRLSAGYGLLVGNFADLYNPGIHVTIGFDTPFFSGWLRNFRFGVLVGYERLTAKNVQNVSIDTIAMMATARYVFSFSSDAFWSRWLPYIQAGAGADLVRLNLADGTGEAGLNPSVLASAGIDFAVTSWLDVSLSCGYTGIFESAVSLQEVRFGGGLSLKL